MNDISAINTTNAALSQIAAKRAAQQAQESTAASSPKADSVEVSQTAHLLGKLQDLPIDSQHIDKIRQQIEDGTYLSDDKIDAAIEALLSDLN
ncbi:MAG: flagellar biosynthesis anti-sigma factor FlgM [Planctomycetota bacterium]|jgi:anti-sigma28 factor (negative regulator of flagellin synthesis)